MSPPGEIWQILSWLYHHSAKFSVYQLENGNKVCRRLSNVDHSATAGPGIWYTTLDCLSNGSVSFTLVNIDRRVCPDLKITLMLNLLQIRLMSSLRSLYDRARNITISQNNLITEESHLDKVLRQNGNPTHFVRAASIPPPQVMTASPEEDQNDGENPELMMIPYVAGLSEDIRRICRRFNIKVIFRSGRTLRSMLTRVKDTLPLDKQSNVVYQIPCSCGMVYIGETKRRLEIRVKEHKDACKKGLMEKSAIAEHAWTHRHPINWDEMSVMAHARGQGELLLKEAIHIQMTPAEDRFNRDGGVELPGCRIAALRRLGGGVDQRRPSHPSHVYPWSRMIYR